MNRGTQSNIGWNTNAAKFPSVTSAPPRYESVINRGRPSVNTASNSKPPMDFNTNPSKLSYPAHHGSKVTTGGSNTVSKSNVPHLQGSPHAPTAPHAPISSHVPTAPHAPISSHVPIAPKVPTAPAGQIGWKVTPTNTGSGNLAAHPNGMHVSFEAN